MVSDSDSGESEDLPEASHEPRECMPCRGSGQVISSLGGTPSKIDCPWCGGSGVRVPETDAQAGWPANDAPVAQTDDAADVTAASADPIPAS